MTELTEPLGFVILDLLPTERQQCLARCAVPRSFTEQTYDTALRGTDGPALAELVDHHQVKATSRKTGHFAVAPMFREAGLTRWWTEEGRPALLQQPVPTDLAKLADDLGERAAKEGRALDQLDLTVLADPMKAATVFTELFTAADEAHDLRLCRSLIDVLDTPERRSLLGDELGRLRNDAALRLSSRTLWASAYHESARYLPRPDVEAPIEDLLAGRRGGVLQFFADGGMGKTMQVRWLIARRCARLDERTVCVRLDFDLIHPVSAAKRPWLLLVEIAAQLDRQIAGAPFQNFLASYGTYRALLNRVEPGAASSGILPAPAPGDDRSATRRFFEVLRELPADHRLLIVIDTTEEMIGPSIDTPAILSLAADLLAASPRCRLLLAGRWDLTNRVPETTKIFPQLCSYRIPPMSVAEQRHYLIETRGITSQDIVDRVVQLSQARPLTLSQYANLVTQSSHVTADVVATFKTPGLVYALERVVERIESRPLQWLVRYGVIPRSLSFDFVLSVLPEFLREGVGGSPRDDPKQDARPQDRPREIFATGFDARFDEAELHSLWESLLGYAAEYSWVSVQSDDRQRVVFRPEFLDALRGLLSDKPICLELQDRAATFYESRSQHTPLLLREATYHRFQISHDAGARAWRTAIHEARTNGHPELALELATDLLGHDYVDWQGCPTGNFSYQLLAEAHLERARAATDIAARDRNSIESRLSDIDASLRIARELALRPDVELSSSALRVLEARLLTAAGRTAEVGPLLADHPADLPAREQAESEHALALSLTSRDRAEASAHFDAAYTLARRAGDDALACQVAVAMADNENERGRHGEALAVVNRAQAEGALGPDDDQARFVVAWSLINAGRPSGAVNVIGDPMDGAVQDRIWAFLFLVIGRYLAGDLFGALDASTAALTERNRGDAPASGMSEVMGWRGTVLSALHAIPLGTDHLLAAAAQARELRDFSSAAHWNAAAAHTLLTVVGDLREAQQCLEEAQLPRTERNSTGWLNGRLVSIQLANRLNRPSDARQLAADALATLAETDAPPRSHVEAMVAALGASSSDELSSRLGQLADYLGTMTPPATWIESLEEFRTLPVLPASEKRGLDRIVAMAKQSVADRELPLVSIEERRQWALLAEVLRVAGERDEAAGALNRAWSNSSDPLAWLHWLEGMDRLGLASSAEQVPPDDALDGLQSDYPLLTAAYRIRLADRRLGVDDAQRAHERLRPVEGLLAASGRHSMWTARLHILRARLAREAGALTEAQHRAADAVRIFSKLGDRVASREVALEFELGEQDPHADVGTIELAAYLVDHDDVEVYVGRAHQALSPRRLPRSLLIPDLSSGAEHGLASGELLSRLWWEWGGRIGRALLPPFLADDLETAGAEGLDLRIVPRAAEIAALPWELLRLDESAERPLLKTPGVATLYRSLPQAPREEAKVRSLQIGLCRLGYLDAVPDGYPGKRTRKAIANFQRDTRLAETSNADRATWTALTAALRQQERDRPLRVLILRPNANNELELERDAAATGLDLPAAYLQRRVRVDVIEDPTLDEVWRYCRNRLTRGVDVVHLCGTPRLAHGSTVLDFGGKISLRDSYWTSGRNEFTVTAMGEVLSALSTDIFSPSVIIDVPTPHTATETFRAMWARNIFAYQMLRLGRVPAVLATGLAAPRQKSPLANAIIGELAGGGDFVDAARAIWRYAEGRPEEVRFATPYLTTALFLQRPPMTILPLRMG